MGDFGWPPGPDSPYKENLSFTEKNIAPKHKLFLDYLTKVADWKLQIEKKRLAGFFNYDKEFESNKNKYESSFLRITDFNRKLGILVFQMNENLLLLNFPDCIPLKHFTLPLKLDAQSVKDLNENSRFYGDSFSMLSPNGKYLVVRRFYSGKCEFLIIDVEKEKLIQKIPISSIEFEYSPNFSDDYTTLNTVNAAYNIITGQKIKDLELQDSNINRKAYTLNLNKNDSTYVIYTGTRAGILDPDPNIPRERRLGFDKSFFKKIKIINANNGSYNLIDTNKIFGSYESVWMYEISPSPDGRYLAAIIVTKDTKKIIIWRITDNDLVKHYEKVTNNVNAGIKFIWHRNKPYLFMTHWMKLWRFDSSKDPIEPPIQIPIEGELNSHGVEISDYYISTYGRFWDLETGKKFWPWYEVLDPFDATNQLPLYETNPKPVILRDYY